MIARKSGQNVNVSVLYLPQLLRLAVGLKPPQMRLDLNLVMTAPFREKLGKVA